MTGWKFNPKCCCGASCNRVGDTFAKEDSSTIGVGEYGPAPVENTGDWDIVDETLHIDSSNAKITWTDTNGLDPCRSGLISVRLKGDDSGDVLRIYGIGNSRVELTVGGSATVKYYDGGSTLRKTVSVTAAENEWHTIEWVSCLLDETLPSVLVYLNGSLVLYGFDSSATYLISNIVSLGTGAISNDAWFDDLSLLNYASPNLLDSSNYYECTHGEDEDDCPDCPETCSVPQSEWTDELDVVVANYHNNGCSDCASLNTTFTLSRVGSFGVSINASHVPLAADACLKYELGGLNLLTTGPSCTTPVEAIIAFVPDAKNPGTDLVPWWVYFLDGAGNNLFSWNMTGSGKIILEAGEDPGPMVKSTHLSLQCVTSQIFQPNATVELQWVA